eukprot:Pgem_evm1s11294
MPKLGLLINTLLLITNNVLANKNVAIFGGGPSGLASALELAEAGFNVTLFEKESMLGGKVASYFDENGLPVSHSPRVMTNAYIGVKDIMDRAYALSGNSNFTALPTKKIYLGNMKRWDYTTFSRNIWSDGPRFLIVAAKFGVYANELDYFAFQCNLYNSLNNTELNRLDKMSWDNWINNFGLKEYREYKQRQSMASRVLINFRGDKHTEGFMALTRSIMGQFVAANPDGTVNTVMLVIQAIGAFVGMSLKHTENCEPYFVPDWVLMMAADGPETITMIEPWEKLLIHKGVRIIKNAKLESVEINNNDDLGNVITKAKVNNENTNVAYEVEADEFVFALPVKEAEYMIQGITKGRDQSVGLSTGFTYYIKNLPQSWEKYVQKNGNIVGIKADSPWECIFILQKAGFNWDSKFVLPANVDAVISAACSEAEEKGTNGKTMLESTEEEALIEVLTQLDYPESLRIDLVNNNATVGLLTHYMDKEHINNNNNTYRSSVIAKANADGKNWVWNAPIYYPTPNRTPLPTSTKYNNLFITGEYVSTPFYTLPTMEQAVEAGKITAQTIIEKYDVNYTVPIVPQLMKLVNANSATEYNNFVQQGWATGSCYNL